MREHLENFFDGFSKTMIDDLMTASRLIVYEKDSIVFFEGEAPKKLHLLIEGSVYVYKSENLKQMQVLRFFKPVGFIAELANIQKIPYPATARCEVRSTIIEIDYEKYLNFFCYSQNHAHIGYSKLLESVADKLTYHVNKSSYSEIVELSAVQKVAKMMLDDLERFNKEKRWKVAQILRINPETLSRTIAKLKKIKAITVEDGKVKILDEIKLQEVN